MEESDLKQNYFSISITELTPGRPRMFPLYLYLALNQRLLLRYTPEDDLSPEKLEACRQKGLTQLWCPRALEPEWKNYLNYEEPAASDAPTSPAGDTDTAPSPSEEAEATLPPEVDDNEAMLAPNPDKPGDTGEDHVAPARLEDPEANATEAPQLASHELEDGGEQLASAPGEAEATLSGPKTEEGAIAVEVIHSPDLSPDEKRTMLAEISIDMLSCLTKISRHDPAATQEALQKCNDFARDVIELATEAHVMDLVYEDLAMLQAQSIEHSTAVATLAVIFAMGLGYFEHPVLSDLSLGAFLHDIGLLTVDPALLKIPVESLSAAQRKEYEGHVQGGLDLLEECGVEINDTVRRIIEQHHEKFDGQGFPKRIQGFQLDELSQLVMLADILQELMQGTRDGGARSPDEALEQIVMMQSAELFPTYFAPELFKGVVGMIREARERTTARAGASGTQEAGGGVSHG